MTMNEVKEFLLWSTLINYGLLFVWFGAFAFARERVYRMHTRWFRLSAETFDAVNYAGAALYKIGIVLFNLVPLVVLHLI